MPDGEEGFFGNLRKRLFGDSDRTRKKGYSRIEAPPRQKLREHEEDLQTPSPKEVKRTPSTPTPLAKPIPTPPPPPPAAKPASRKRQPFFVQIGLDFGTAYTKCVYRDVFTDKARIFLPLFVFSKTDPFLYPNWVGFDGERLTGPSVRLTSNEIRLDFIKTAIESVAVGNLDDPSLRPFEEARGQFALRDFVEMVAAYFLAGILGQLKCEIKKGFPGSDKNDYIAVNFAVPVASLAQTQTMEAFQRVLQLGWVLADELTAHPAISAVEMAARIQSKREASNHSDVKELCYIYPEVSANVQGFVRSRVSRPGIYLFSDTGAGTVDQSMFIFGHQNGLEKLTYLNAAVYPLGSSNIERAVAKLEGDTSLAALRKWREAKENGMNSPSMRNARNEIFEKLEKLSLKTIADGKLKLYRKSQLSDLKVVFGGGGHVEFPYGRAVLSNFKSLIFDDIAIKKREFAGDNFEVGMPLPRDITNTRSVRDAALSRLSVAYGLSFEKGQLSDFVLPANLSTPKEEDIWKPRRRPAFDYSS